MQIKLQRIGRSDRQIWAISVDVLSHSHTQYKAGEEEEEEEEEEGDSGMNQTDSARRKSQTNKNNTDAM